MCGRFVSASPPDEIARYFDVVDVAEEVLDPSYNVAPTDDVYVVREEDERRALDAFHWGLVPRWAKDPSIGNRMINARSEGAADNNAFKWPLRKRRCIVPADGFYEWKKVSGNKIKQPYYFTRVDGELLAFAGLWEEWRGPERDGSQFMRSVTILTTAANGAMSPIHDRMPVILPPSSWDGWLDRSQDDLANLDALLVPAPDSLLAMRAVSTEVNNARSAGRQLIDPVEPAATEVQGTLL